MKTLLALEVGSGQQIDAVTAQNAGREWSNMLDSDIVFRLSAEEYFACVIRNGQGFRAVWISLNSDGSGIVQFVTDHLGGDVAAIKEIAQAALEVAEEMIA